jgi:glycosyltransferase involved in cell wall biosynthesis
MRVLKVWDSEYPWDVRTEKVCKALRDFGWEVHLLARNRGRRPEVERLDEGLVHRLRSWSAFGSSLDAASQFPAFFNPRWARHIHRVGRSEGVDVILVRDLPLAPTAIFVGRRLGVPVVLDMAENYPAMIRDLWTTGATSFGDFLVRNPRLVEMVERYVLSRVDHTVVVVEESKERLLALGVPGDRVTVVSNTPSLSRVDEFEGIRAASRESVADAPGKGTMPDLRLTYLGLMEEARGVSTVIDAVARVRSDGVEVILDLIGDGRALDDFKRRCADLGLGTDAVRFHGFLPYPLALEKVAEADVGLIPHFANESWQTTIPNKLFDYMSLGLAVIASDVRPVARVLNQTGAGVIYRDRDAGDLARAIREVASSADRGALGRRGVDEVRSRYNWDRDRGGLRTALQAVVAGGTGS